MGKYEKTIENINDLRDHAKKDLANIETNIDIDAAFAACIENLQKGKLDFAISKLYFFAGFLDGLRTLTPDAFSSLNSHIGVVIADLESKKKERENDEYSIFIEEFDRKDWQQQDEIIIELERRSKKW